MVAAALVAWVLGSFQTHAAVTGTPRQMYCADTQLDSGSEPDDLPDDIDSHDIE